MKWTRKKMLATTDCIILGAVGRIKQTLLNLRVAAFILLYIAKDTLIAMVTMMNAWIYRDICPLWVSKHTAHTANFTLKTFYGTKLYAVYNAVTYQVIKSRIRNQIMHDINTVIHTSHTCYLDLCYTYVSMLQYACMRA